MTSIVDVNSAAVGQYTITGLTNGTTYDITVSALNNGVESGPSNVKSAMPSVKIAPADPVVVMDATYGYRQSANAISESVVTAGDPYWTNYDVQAEPQLAINDKSGSNRDHRQIYRQ